MKQQGETRRPSKGPHKKCTRPEPRQYSIAELERARDRVEAVERRVESRPTVAAKIREDQLIVEVKRLVSREEASLSLDSLLLRPGKMHLALSLEHVTVKISYPLSPSGSHVEVSNGCLHARSDTVPVELGI